MIWPHLALLRSQTDYGKIRFLEIKAWNTGGYFHHKDKKKTASMFYFLPEFLDKKKKSCLRQSAGCFPHAGS